MRGALKSALLGSKLRILLTAVLALGVVVAGGFSLGLLGAPSVGGVQNQFGDVTDETTEIRTDLAVHNPNPFGASLGGVSVEYGVRMNDVGMANGSKQGVSVASGNSTLEFTTLMDNERIPPWWVSHVRNDEKTTVRVDATVRSGTLGRSFEAPPVERQVSTDVISQFNSTEDRPINADAPLVSDPIAYVNETSARWGAVTRAETPIDMRFRIYNAKTAPLAITEIGYTITMNDVTVGNGSSESAHVVEGHSTETIETTTAIDNGKLDDWWVTHLDNEQVTQLRIDFYAKMEFAGETFRVPLDQLTYEKTVETDIFGTKAESSDAGNAGDGSSDDGGSDEGDTTASDDGQTTDGSDAGTTQSDGTATTPEGTTTDSGNGETTDGGDSDTTTTDDGGLLALDSAEIR